MQSCKCSNYGFAVQLHEELFEDFVRPLELVRQRGVLGEVLYRCRVCSQFWFVDEGSRWNCAAKLTSESEFEGFDLRLAHRGILLQQSEVGEGKCMWRGCTNTRLKNIVFCFEHKYPECSLEALRQKPQ